MILKINDSFNPDPKGSGFLLSAGENLHGGEGKSPDQCLEKLSLLKDHWFDWKNYKPHTAVYRR